MQDDSRRKLPSHRYSVYFQLHASVLRTVDLISIVNAVVWNLLTNAVKFTPKEGKIQVMVQRINSHVEIVVSDSGVGINKDFLPYVFDRFRQADATTTRIHGGLGLGLSIVRQLVDLHGGSVNVHSEGEGKGATFTITLPFVGVISNQKESESVHPTQDDEDVSFEGLPSLQGLKVLVVDDEADTRELICEVLKECGSEVKTSRSVPEALEAQRFIQDRAAGPSNLKEQAKCSAIIATAYLQRSP